ncbi:putative fad dependent protein [Botrytis fragariae]|uniref:Fumarate reductase n=1 Tax=Botrytis fragariae TaxID=1964551 RepID=A0A8H6EFV8_9HELO|nr:putative fad dependent protein [Botrytis fragariae]KAF5870633.1 putative fad dependent protein [Botrytis fragariae]
MAQSHSQSGKKVAIVIGSGLAGLAASSQILSQSHDIKVYLLEQSDRTGGNSIKASSGINGARTSFQLASNPPIVDSVDTFYNDSIKSAAEAMRGTGNGEAERKERERLIRVLSEESKGAVEWLGSKGVDLSVIAQLGGHSIARTHRGGGKSKPPGAAIVGTLSEELKGNDRFHLKTSCRVIRVIKSDRNEDVRGVECICDDDNKTPKVEVLIGPLIFATGGFAGDAYGMLARYRPDLSGIPSTNDQRSGSQELLSDIGAGLIDMEKVQIHPTAFVDLKDINNPTKFLAAEMLRGEGGVLLMNGRRFVNELEARKIVSGKIMEVDEIVRSEGHPRQWNVKLVIDQGVYEKAKSHVDFYLWKGLMRKCTIAEENFGEDAIRGLQRYADAIAKRSKDEFGRKSFGCWKLNEVKPDSVIYVGNVTPAVHFTMGGVKIDEQARVLTAEGDVIRGVWAAGEVTGGIHGDNRLGGSSLLECVIFGRKAGDGVLKSLERSIKE